MNMRKRTLFVIWTVVSAAALCLCVILTVCHARAEEAPVQIRAGSYDDSLYYAGTLPDGGILLNGVKSRDYDGGDVTYPGGKVMKVCDFPFLANLPSIESINVEVADARRPES